MKNMPAKRTPRNSTLQVYPEAPWSVRLAAKLLREFKKGEASPWYPYLTVLPGFKPGLMHCASWEDISAIHYEPLRLELYNLLYSEDDFFRNLTPEATSHATQEEFRWAMGMAHSRWAGGPCSRISSLHPS